MPRNVLHRLVDKIAQKLLGPAVYAAAASPPGDDIRYWLGQAVPASGAAPTSRGAQTAAGPMRTGPSASEGSGAARGAMGASELLRPRPIMAIR